MDFDDLDAADGFILNNQPPKGTVLPLVVRDRRIPTGTWLPESVQKKLPPVTGELVERNPKLRLLCLMGAADGVVQEWCYMEHEAPPEIEMVVHEPPGHGTRKDEPVCKTLQELGDDAFEALRDAMDTGAFALLGHSIGCLTATYIAERAKRELNVEPLLTIMVERGAAHIPAFSDYGYDLLKSDPVRFMQIRDPSTSKAITLNQKENGELSDFGQGVLRMWSNDLLIENDTRPVGWYRFPCPILVFRCKTMKLQDLAKEILEANAENIRIHKKCDYIGHFDGEHCAAWSEWTEHTRGSPQWLLENYNHMSIKASKEMRSTIWSELRAIINAF
eukprot:TRINITY_DN28329_c0_g1_i1.p1 TRINITY_DN28329_c0_g1~~TRINITY_DN28329_c0_g1_i1.p1  ORF type:complete len:340 (+),score=60.64 TRINITY_DN28329_c0_g1_i1:22-1020(+)